MTILLFAIILGVLVFVHELGHFLAARWSGVAVEEFGFGFPPRLIGWRRGQTVYSLNWIPFGGFVRLQGEQADAAARPDSFSQAKFFKQFFILAAGVAMNALLAWILLTATLISGVKTDPSTAPHNRYIQSADSRVEAVVTDGGPAAQSGLRTGDEVLRVNGQPLTTTDQIISLTKERNYPPLELDIRRREAITSLRIVPRMETDRPRYGLGIQAVTTILYPWYVAPWYAVQTTGQLVGQTVVGFIRLLQDLVTTARVSPDLTGPVGIAVLTSQVVQYGVIATLQFMAILSISLAVVNFLPIPALDGGRAVFAVLARVRGRPIDTRIEGAIHTVGFYGLLLVIILLSVRDVSRFRIVEQLRSLFQ